MAQTPIPADLVDISRQIREQQTGDEKANSLAVEYFARLCNLRAAIRKGKLSDRHSILAEAQALEDDTASWPVTVPASMDYHEEAAEPSAQAYAATCHVYASVFSAEVWNMYRSVRIGTLGIIVEQSAILALESGGRPSSPPSSPSSSSSSPSGEAASPATTTTTTPSSSSSEKRATDLTAAANRMHSLREDICHSIPYILDRHGPQPRRTTELSISVRTPALYTLIFLRVSGAGGEMAEWTRARIEELQLSEQEDRGAIWMNLELPAYAAQGKGGD